MKRYINSITKEIDKHLLEKCKNGFCLNSYIVQWKDNNQELWCIRFSGATRAYIKVDKESVIIDIQIYDNAILGKSKCYKESVRDGLSKYVGTKLFSKWKGEKNV